MIRKSSRHGWSDRLPTSQRSRASRWLRLWQGLAETAMWQRQMVVCQREPQLSLKPREVFGEAIGAPCSATIALTLRQVVAFNKAGVDGCAGWRCGQLLRDRLQITEDHFAVNLHDTPTGSRLHDLSIQQLWRWHEQGFGIA